MFITLRINRKMLAKDELFEDIIKKEPKIKEMIEKRLGDGGIVFGSRQKKKFKIIYIFKKEQNEEKKILKLTKRIITDDTSESMIKEADEIVKEEMKEIITLEDEIDEVKWEDEIFTPNKIKVVGKYEIGLGVFFLILGIILWITFDELLFFIGGILLSTVSGVLVKSKKTKK